MSGSSRVGVILVNWNSGALTLDCIRSLLAGTENPWRIVVYDNGSQDGSADLIASMYPSVDLIRGPENIGFTGGNNEGIRHLLQAGADFVWILNNDTVVESDCLRNLADALRGNPNIAVATGRILSEWEDPTARRLWYAGGAIDPWTLKAAHRGVGQIDSGQYDQRAEVTFISGCCMLVRRGVLEDVGLFDDHFFAYYEDVEWCLRAARRGHVLCYVPSAMLGHRVMAVLRGNVGCGGGKYSPRFHYLSMRNRILTVRLHRGGWRRAAALLCVGADACTLLAGFLLRGRWAKIGALTRGVMHGLRMPLQPAGSGSH